MNRLFVAYKPPFISSHAFLGRLKRKYGVKKAGFSGTLDPIAKGVLIVAFGNYTKLFRFLKKAPKKYKATLWLGAVSDGFDIERVQEVIDTQKLNIGEIKKEIDALKNLTHQTPPKFSAKWIDGKRAYDLARKGEEFDMKSVPVAIYEADFINYSHPFLTFEATVSEGAYIRSLAQTLCQNLNTIGALSSLERVSEGGFVFEGEKSLHILEHINLPSNSYNGEMKNIQIGKKLKKEDFETKENGVYKIIQEKNISVIEISDERVDYLINQLEIF